MLLHNEDNMESWKEGGGRGRGEGGKKSISSSFFQVLYTVVMQAYTLVGRLGSFLLVCLVIVFILYGPE